MGAPAPRRKEDRVYKTMTTNWLCLDPRGQGLNRVMLRNRAGTERYWEPNGRVQRREHRWRERDMRWWKDRQGS